MPFLFLVPFPDLYLFAKGLFFPLFHRINFAETACVEISGERREVGCQTRDFITCETRDGIKQSFHLY